MAINRKFFFDHVRIKLFDGSLKTAQVDGLTAILDKWEAATPDDDDRWLAYMLGTAHHETGRTMQPVRETFASSDKEAIARLAKAWNAGQLTWVKEPYWMPDASGRSWLGRGLVQLTHRANYANLDTMIHAGLVADPARAMDMPVALDVMFVGMRRGAFTGRKLADFFSGTAREDWRGARKIINGTERADLVASYAKAYYAAISHTT